MYTREQILEAVNNCLDERERSVIISRFGLKDGVSKTLSEIQTNLGVTRVQVRAIEKKVLNYINEHRSS